MVLSAPASAVAGCARGAAPIYQQEVAMLSVSLKFSHLV
jgi:hypothetical protein